MCPKVVSVPPEKQAPARPVPRRSRIVMWLAMLAVGATVALAVLDGARTASLFLAGTLAVLAVVRGVAPAPGPYGISTRSRTFDVTILAVGATVIGVLALITQRDAL